MTLAPGTRLGPYEILAPIGAGGMGEVYRAKDPRLGREVAIKILPASFSADVDRLRRFELEARAAGILNHPNITVVYDIGEHDGAPYVVQELLEGETLRSVLTRGKLSPRRAIDAALQIVRGLAAAHQKGIIHRDLKPENLFVTKDGTLKILDFGLAKVTRLVEALPGDTTALTAGPRTEVGVVMGSAGYMSPEQVRGKPVDLRSDLFSFGAVLYEMLTGERAFPGATTADSMAAVLTKDPPALSERLPDVSPALERVVERCLEKEPEARFHSAHDLAFDLQTLRDLSPSGSSRSAKALAIEAGRGPLLRRAAVAAVPVVLVAAVVLWLARPKPSLSFAPRDWVLVADVRNETGEPVFDRSLFTALTVSLEQSAHANVFPRARVAAALARMKRDPGSPIDAEIGREICLRENVKALVTCNIARTGTHYLLAARIVDPRTGEAFRSFEEQARGEDAVLPAVSSLATRIREGLGEALPAIQHANRPLPQVTTASLKALELYADGQQLWTKGNYDEAVKMYESALQEDPGFAMAHAALGNAYMSHVYSEPVRGRESYARALELASRTTDRERLLIQAEAAAGGDASEAMRLYGAYLATYPDDTSVRYSLGTLLMLNKRQAEALEQFREVIRIAPASANSYINMATSLIQLGRPREALDAYAKAFALEPTWVTSGNLNHEYGFALVAAGNVAKAREIFAKALATKDLRARGLRSLALLDLYQGRYRAAAEGFREAILLNEAAKAELSASRDHVFLAILRDGQGDRAGQLAELDRAGALLNQREAEVIWTSRLGALYARAGAMAQAERLKEVVTKKVQPASAEEMSHLHRMEGEIEVAHGHLAAALEKLRLADREFRTGETLESLAHAAWVAGDVAQAVTTYETLLAMDNLGWEAQQPWVTANYDVALAYRAAGQPAKARDAAEKLLTLWTDADPDLPLLRKARELRRQLDR